MKVDCVVKVVFETYPVGTIKPSPDGPNKINPTVSPLPELAVVVAPLPKLPGLEVIPVYVSQETGLLPCPLLKFAKFGLTNPLKLLLLLNPKLVVLNLPVPDNITFEPDSNKTISKSEPTSVVLLGVGVGVTVGVGVKDTVESGVTEGVVVFVGVTVLVGVKVGVGVTLTNGIIESEQIPIEEPEPSAGPLPEMVIEVNGVAFVIINFPPPVTKSGDVEPPIIVLPVIVT